LCVGSWASNQGCGQEKEGVHKAFYGHNLSFPFKPFREKG
jgi:hypothetical protein